ERQATMSLAENEPVPVGPARFARPVTQQIVIQNPDDLDQRQCRANVPPPALFDGPEDQTPEVLAALVKGLMPHRLKIGIVVQQRCIAHVEGYTISLCGSQHI